MGILTHPCGLEDAGFRTPDRRQRRQAFLAPVSPVPATGGAVPDLPPFRAARFGPFAAILACTCVGLAERPRHFAGRAQMRRNISPALERIAVVASSIVCERECALMRRRLTRTGLVLAAVVALVGGASAQASAALGPIVIPPPAFHLSASGSVYIVNDEPFWYDHDTGTHDLAWKSLDMPSSSCKGSCKPSAKTMDWKPCQGGEVTAWAQVSGESLDGGRIKVRVGLLLMEGSRCGNDVGDSGNLDDVYFVLGPNQSKDVKLSADHKGSTQHDRADLTITVRNTCTFYALDLCGG